MATQSDLQKRNIVPPFFIHSLLVGMTLVFLLGGAYVGYLLYFTVKGLAANAKLPSLPYVDLSLPLGTLPLTGDNNASVLAPIRGGESGATSITGVPLPDYEQKERVNILLLGVDKRPDETFSRTDTMIVVTVDPNTKTAGMLSVPRDLWVAVPGYYEDRVNKAYYFGERDAYPGGGPGLAMKTLQYNLGIPIHFYVRVDFDGFRKIVDTLGGIDVYIPETINDPDFPDNNYGVDPFYIEAGQHTLDGYDALRYARTRATIGSDFDRAKRQQAVLLAIRDKALQLNMVPKIPELWATMAGTVETDLQLVDIVELAQLADEIDGENIDSVVIDSNYTVDYIADTGAQVLLPLRDKIRPVIEEIFAETKPADGPSQVEVEAAQTAQAQARAQQIEQEAQRQEEVKTFLNQEDAKLVVQNGTDLPSLATQTASYLKQQGFNILQFGPADAATYPSTVVVVYDEEKRYTLEVLKALFEVAEENIRRSPNLKSDVDFRVIIGSDFELPGGSQSLLIPE